VSTVLHQLPRRVVYAMAVEAGIAAPAPPLQVIIAIAIAACAVTVAYLLLLYCCGAQTPAELDALLTPEWHSSAARALTQRAFTSCDADGDGRLAEPEFRAWMASTPQVLEFVQVRARARLGDYNA
jgi:hypothetical protein